MKDRLIALAREAGFAEISFASPEPVKQDAPLHPQAAALVSDAACLMPGAKCIMLMAMPYQPFHYEGDDAQIDAYYLTSNAAHEAAKQLAARIEETLSVRAIASPPVFLKPLAARSGLGEFGRNGLVSVGRYGTRAALQAILLDAPVETTRLPVRALSALCTDCRACLDACPTQALTGDGNIDLSRCLRAQPEGEAFPVPLREKLGASILGCDLCQQVCPRNAQVSSVPAPDALKAALQLHSLMEGAYQPLIPFLGKNNARRQRLTARALIAAANLNRKDLIPLIDDLTGCRESEMVREHAQWAKAQLESRQNRPG